MGKSRYCITLVHGTFVPDAAWARPGSTLWSGLESGLVDVRFKPFSWDGKNDDRSRASAAAKLAGQIREGIVADPEAVHAIVSHSHGGNIALRAAADSRIAARLSSLVCMSTPFFVSKGRDIVTATSAFARGLAWFFGVTSLIFVLAQFTDFSRWRKYGMPRTIAEFRWWVIAAAVGLIVALVLQLSRKRISAWVAQRQAHRIDEVTLSKLGPARILCIWAKGDEVMLAFRALDRLASLSVLLLRPSSAVAAFVLSYAWLALAGRDAIQEVLKIFGYAFFSIVVTLFLPFALLAEYAAKSIRIDVSLLMPLAAAVMAAMTIALLTAGIWITAAILHVILKLRPFGMKDWRFVDTFFLRISPSPTPPDSSSVLVEEMTLPRGGLMHSAIYGSDIGLQKIVAFIRGSPGPARQDAITIASRSAGRK